MFYDRNVHSLFWYQMDKKNSNSAGFALDLSNIKGNFSYNTAEVINTYTVCLLRSAQKSSGVCEWPGIFMRYNSTNLRHHLPIEMAYAILLLFSDNKNDEEKKENSILHLSSYMNIRTILNVSFKCYTHRMNSKIVEILPIGKDKKYVYTIHTIKIENPFIKWFLHEVYFISF